MKEFERYIPPHLTIGELREIIKDLPDNMKIFKLDMDSEDCIEYYSPVSYAKVKNKHFRID